MDKEIKKESSALYFLRIGGTLLLMRHCGAGAVLCEHGDTGKDRSKRDRAKKDCHGRAFRLGQDRIYRA